MTTVIVLLILAGVSIARLMGEDGLFNQATSVKEKTAFTGAEEKLKIAITGAFDNTGKRTDC